MNQQKYQQRQHLRLPSWRWLLLIFLLPTALLADMACAKEEPPFDRDKMFQETATNIVLPYYAELEAAALALKEASTTLCKEPTEANLKAAQNAWRKTRLARKRSQVLRYGPAEKLDSRTKIDTWPAKTDKIDADIAGTQTIDTKYIDSLGASRRGLAAVEYLMFHPEGNGKVLPTLKAQGDTPSRQCQYIAATAETIYAHTQQLYKAWKDATPEARIAMFVSPLHVDKLNLTRQAAVDEVINEMYFLVQRITDTKLGGPLGKKSGGEVRPDEVESPRAKQSLEEMIANIEGLQALYLGTYKGKSGLSISALVKSQNELVDKHVVRDLESALIALKAIKGPLRDAVTTQKDKVENAYKVLKQVSVTLTVEVANVLGVLLTFSDNDGD